MEKSYNLLIILNKQQRRKISRPRGEMLQKKRNPNWSSVAFKFNKNWDGKVRNSK